MGIVNATPDSFSDGGRSPEEVLEHALRLADDGADILDFGGESTRPGAKEVPAEEELRRVIPVLKQVKKLRPGIRVSADTRKSEVAHAALECGAEIINDVSGLLFDSGMAEVCAEFDATVILGHTRGTPEEMAKNCCYQSAVQDVLSELRGAAEYAVRRGVRREKLWFDPGIGFAKTPEQSWELVRHAEAFNELGPVVIGHSRKSFLGFPVMRDLETATAVLGLLLKNRQVHVLRVHDVRAVRVAWETAEKFAGKER